MGAPKVMRHNDSQNQAIKGTVTSVIHLEATKRRECKQERLAGVVGRILENLKSLVLRANLCRKEKVQLMASAE